METNGTNITTKRNVPLRLCGWTVAIAAVLMIPYLSNAPWTGSDFVFAGIVLFICATTYELVTKNMTSLKDRAYIAAAVFFFIFLVIGWAASGP